MFWISNTMEMVERLAYYGLRTVIAVYMVAAIAEGANRRTDKEKADRFTLARTEAGEAAAWCEMAMTLEIGDPKTLRIAHRYDRVNRMLSGHTLIRTHASP